MAFERIVHITEIYSMEIRVSRKERIPSLGITLQASFAFKVLIYRTKENFLFYGNTNPFLTI